ncbi:hypothetical protein ABIA30_002563 [Mycobacterium sp. MAA66]|uniref:DUF2752 domain-containing protein n=1 Tax=Mycobacterium sp. MAA66 TaxID=3156297 RepID=UPI0035131447
MQLLPRAGAMSPLVAPLAVAVAAGSACCLVWAGNPTVPGGPIPVCPTKALFGIDCPGCGSLRMLYSVMHGDVPTALKYNAVGLVALVLLVWAYGAWAYGRIAGRRVRSWQQHRWAAASVLAVVCVWSVIRNLPIAPFNSLYV